MRKERRWTGELLSISTSEVPEVSERPESPKATHHGKKANENPESRGRSSEFQVGNRKRGKDTLHQAGGVRRICMAFYQNAETEGSETAAAEAKAQRPRMHTAEREREQW